MRPVTTCHCNARPARSCLALAGHEMQGQQRAESWLCNMREPRDAAAAFLRGPRPGRQFLADAPARPLPSVELFGV